MMTRKLFLPTLLILLLFTACEKEQFTPKGDLEEGRSYETYELMEGPVGISDFLTVPSSEPTIRPLMDTTTYYAMPLFGGADNRVLPTEQETNRPAKPTDNADQMLRPFPGISYRPEN